MRRLGVATRQRVFSRKVGFAVQSVQNSESVSQSVSQSVITPRSFIHDHSSIYIHTIMPLPFLLVLPREIRDQVYTYVLASPSGIVNLSPWNFDIVLSLSLLRTCKQIRRECKDIIWEHNSLSIREPTELFQHWRLKHIRGVQHVKICLELLDRDELGWMGASLKALAGWRVTHSERLKSITLVSVPDRPRTLEEFYEETSLRIFGSLVDGRLYQDSTTTPRNMVINTGWPHFTNWGNRSWLRAMLQDPIGIPELLKEMHNTFGGELLVDGLVCFKDGAVVGDGFGLDPLDGEIKIIPG
jgi:hypothetical protein